MASYSVALQLRAAQEVIKREMPLRSLATRVLLMCDVASALLLIQLGQFTHPATGLVLNNTDFPFDISIYLYMFGLCTHQCVRI